MYPPHHSCLVGTLQARNLRADSCSHAVQVLTWSAYRNDAFAADRLAQTKTATFNPNTGAITEVTVTNTNHDMFCPGITMLGSGSIVVTGGDTSEKTSIYDQAAGWKPGPDMNIPRGYQSSTLTSTGKVCKRRTAFTQYFCAL